MPADVVSILSLLWGLFINTLTFLAAHTSLGAWIRHLASRLIRKLRSWGFEWPETPVPPDRQELRDTPTQIQTSSQGCLVEMRVMSGLLREVMGQGTNHHSEIRDVLSDIHDGLYHISSDARAITEVLTNNTLRADVHVMVAFEVDRLLRRLPQLMREAKTEAKPRHQRAASA